MVDATNDKDYFEVEIKDPDGVKMLKTCTHEDYLKICKKYGIVSEGRWKEWGKGKAGNPVQIPVQE